jgi:hypothetical protein
VLEDRSVRTLLADLETQVEKLRQSVALHERQEEHHREQVNRQFGDKMRRTLDSRQVSVSLRRLEERGRLRLVRKGRSYSEALYERVGGG